MAHTLSSFESLSKSHLLGEDFPTIVFEVEPPTPNPSPDPLLTSYFLLVPVSSDIPYNILITP